MFAFALLITSMASLVTSMASMQAEVATMAQQIRWQPEIMDKMGNTIPRKDTADPTSLSPEWRCTVGCDSLPDLELEGVDDYAATLAEHGMEEWEEYDYEDYGLDYGDDLDASGGNILKGLSPDALKTVSPELLASYLANATPEDLGGLLGEPATLASLPVATVVGLVQGLPWHMLLVVLESEGLRQLVATAPEDRRAREWLEGITPALVGVLEGEQLARVPDYLLEFALTSSPAVTALLDVPEKLEEVAREHPRLLQKVGPARVAEVLAELPDSQLLRLAQHPRLVLLLPDHALLALLARRPHLLRRLPRGVLGRLLRAPGFQRRFPRLLRLLPAPALARLATSRPWLVTYLPTVSLLAMVSRKDLLPLLSDQALVNLLTFRPSLLTALPAPLVAGLVAGRPALLAALPPAAEPALQQLLPSRQFVAQLPTSLLVTLASSPTIQRLLTKEAIVQVLTLHPSLPSLLPTSSLLPLLSHLTDPTFASLLPCTSVAAVAARPAVVAAMPRRLLAAVATDRRLLACIPPHALAALKASPVIVGRTLMAQGAALSDHVRAQVSRARAQGVALKDRLRGHVEAQVGRARAQGAALGARVLQLLPGPVRRLQGRGQGLAAGG